MNDSKATDDIANFFSCIQIIKKSIDVGGLFFISIIYRFELYYLNKQIMFFFGHIKCMSLLYFHLSLT